MTGFRLALFGLVCGTVALTMDGWPPQPFVAVAFAFNVFVFAVIIWMQRHPERAGELDIAEIMGGSDTRGDDG